MNDAATLSVIKALVASGKVEIATGDVLHFVAGSSVYDAIEALASATSCVAYHTDGQWLVSGGSDLQGEAMRLVVEIEEGVLIVSLQYE